MYRDRLGLTERANLVFKLAKKWKPLSVGYEEYGLQADISHLKDRMNRENYHFQLVPLGGKLQKNERIKRLLPLFEQGRIYLPQSCHRTNREGVTEDLVEIFINQEYRAFPVAIHDDMLDALARILDEDLHASWPAIWEDKPKRYTGSGRSKTSWMSSL
jgi:phage terminase large subunit-like protein